MSKNPKTVTILDAIRHADLFGSLPAFSSLDSWKAWTVWLKAIFALPMTDDELTVYRQCTGRTEPPKTEPSEAYTICGRRGGKSFISALTAVYLGCFRSYRQYLNAGEKATVLILARDRDQSRVVFGYVGGIINSIPALRQMIVAERVDEIELENGVVLAVKTSDYRSIRGLTIVVCIADEIAFWESQGVSPDYEILTALRPAMATIPNSKLLVISTPYAQAGVLYEQHRDYYAKDDEHTLVWQAPSATMNPTISEELIQREIERDPDGASAEWLAVFRTDLQAAFSPESLEACTIKGRVELPASPIIEYRGFCDPSGGKVDAFTLAIGHKGDEGRVIIDLAREWPSPFNPKEITAEIAAVLKSYGVLNVTGDRYASEWPIAEFSVHGVSYQQCAENRSELYLAFIPVTNSSGVELPDDKRLLTQLSRLERKRGRAGKDSVDHPPRLHDDLANAVAGVSYLLSNAKPSQHEFNPALHISRQGLRLATGNWPLFIGLSFADGIVATVIGQTYNNEIRIFAAFVSEGQSPRRHLVEYVEPWLSANAPRSPRLPILGAYAYEDATDLKEIQSGVLVTVRELLGGSWMSISKSWELRRDSMLDSLTRAQAFTFKPVIQFSPTNTLPLSQALNSGRFHEKVLAEKKHFHVANAFSVLLSRGELWKAMPGAPKPQRIAPSAMSA